MFVIIATIKRTRNHSIDAGKNRSVRCNEWYVTHCVTLQRLTTCLLSPGDAHLPHRSSNSLISVNRKPESGHAHDLISDVSACF